MMPLSFRLHPEQSASLRNSPAESMQFAPQAPIYMDYASTTHIDPRALTRLYELLSDKTIGNPHAVHHQFGRRAKHVITEARSQVASRVGSKSSEITFTSGATESNNLVLSGLADYLRLAGNTHIISSAIEHKSILSPLARLQEQGFKITLLQPQPCGMIDSSTVENALRPNTGLVTIQTVNNEVGTIQPLAEIAEVLEGKDVLFHTDSAQALGKLNLDLSRTGVDFASLSSHKAHGPQGVGALFVKSGREKLLQPQLLGGNQEWGLRSGTVPVALCGSFGTACSVIVDDRSRILSLRQRLLQRLEALRPFVHGHWDQEWNVPGILNLRFPGIDSETLMMALPRVALSSGAACSEAKDSSSHVIAAMTGSTEFAGEAVRLSFGRFTTEGEIDYLADQLIDAVISIRNLQEAEI
ncbi:aminotransferase class V-fold PLP-dependent enzyme [bacterium]|nr:aminotransferase class V-fold PLP-dependent enzyme [bacterium]